MTSEIMKQFGSLQRRGNLENGVYEVLVVSDPVDLVGKTRGVAFYVTQSDAMAKVVLYVDDFPAFLYYQDDRTLGQLLSPGRKIQLPVYRTDKGDNLVLGHPLNWTGRRAKKEDAE